MAFLDTGPLNSRSRPSFTIAPPRNTVPPPDISCTRGPPELSFKPRSRVNPAVLMVPQKVPIAITPGLSTKNDHESPPPSPLDQGENVPSAISLPLRVQPQTPPAASGPHQLLPSPPPSSERPTSVISDFQYAILAPYLQPPKVPSAIHLLTADLFPKLAANAHSSALTIPCLPQQFSVWRTRNSHWLQDFDSRWEYSSREGLFIIKCMPTPIHEAFSMHATCVIHEELRKITSLRASSTNISVATNTDLIGPPHLPSRHIPDLSFKVRLHPPTPVQTRRGVVVEVGFAQSFPSLLHRAQLWLLDRRDQVHMVILVHIPEVIPTKYMLPQDHGGVEISAGKARKEMFKWQKAWFGGRNFEEEVITRWIGEEEGKEQEVVSELKTDVMNKLLEEDEKGSLVPPLLHPLDGKIYVFKRKEEGQGVELISSQGASAKESQIEETQAGKRKREEEGDLSGNEDVNVNNSSAEIFSNVHPTATFNPSSISSSTDEEDEESDRSSQLMCIYDTSFLHNNIYTPGTPPTPHALTISITDLYGPYPTPSTLSLIPLTLRPHAHQKITLDLEEIAERIIAEDVLCEMRVRRAGERAAKIIDGAWVAWVKKREDERNRVRMEEERNERNERRVRRVREVGNNMGGPNEREAGSGRKRGRGTSRD